MREPPPRHPWLGEFLRAPEAAFASLLGGYARIPPYERADAPDAARMLFGPLPADDPKQRQPDIHLAQDALDWQPKIQLVDGLKKTIAYFDELLSQSASGDFSKLS